MTDKTTTPPMPEPNPKRGKGEAAFELWTLINKYVPQENIDHFNGLLSLAAGAVGQGITKMQEDYNSYTNTPPKPEQPQEQESNKVAGVPVPPTIQNWMKTLGVSDDLAMDAFVALKPYVTEDSMLKFGSWVQQKLGNENKFGDELLPEPEPSQSSGVPMTPQFYGNENVTTVAKSPQPDTNSMPVAGRSEEEPTHATLGTRG